MESVSRRSFLAVTAGAAGTAALITASSAPAGADDSTRKPGDRNQGGESSGLIVQVRDGKTGEVAIYADETETIVKDRNLSDAIARAAKGRK
jgi:hypothetical protein